MKQNAWDCEVGDWLSPDYFSIPVILWAIALYPRKPRMLFRRRKPGCYWIRQKDKEIENIWPLKSLIP